MKVTQRAASLIPKGTYVPSNLSKKDLLEQAKANNPNTMASKEEILARLGFTRKP